MASLEPVEMPFLLFLVLIVFDRFFVSVLASSDMHKCKEGKTKYASRDTT